MDRKCKRMTEGVLYFFSLPHRLGKAKISEAIDSALAASQCGRITGSGISLLGDCLITMDIKTSNRDTADTVISRTCEKLKCRDFEMVWA